MICPCCKQDGLKQTKSRCTNCKRTLAERRKWLDNAAEFGADFCEVTEARRAKQRAHDTSKYERPERDELGAHHFGGTSRADAGWLFGGG